MASRKTAKKTRPAARRSDRAAPARPAVAPAPTFPIVGIGASAGGLEAFEQLFRAMPTESGLAFVLVPHRDPGHASVLGEILQRFTAMPVVEATDQMAVAPDTVHIISPNRDLAIFHGILHLSVPEAPCSMSRRPPYGIPQRATR